MIAATTTISIHALRVEGDENPSKPTENPQSISIHALRVEGDRGHYRRAATGDISIHALRVEGDAPMEIYRNLTTNISIHALRVEGDGVTVCTAVTRAKFLSTPSGWRATDDKIIDINVNAQNFYPRPPGGGRRFATRWAWRKRVFLSTPSGWRATNGEGDKLVTVTISIHALRVEGDL